ncbi:fumarylacetoacetate hydrolase family protein [Saliterribacillus persicus]|uniref:2-dehydro-3-deoxy-D-arabinonate dehydratase n=1 Tax=Saliterribacillus persicus TaxID=930114 RepID=A0A368YAB5_9BACI|nr:fumarylacetoacetate hydrolase family protein [Saliterribacillus persicus]RCW77210.1 2-dehydro-3-deoxy-D-arabinonate dehydratase [Saliterribacillus persicus]
MRIISFVNKGEETKLAVVKADTNVYPLPFESMQEALMISKGAGMSLFALIEESIENAPVLTEKEEDLNLSIPILADEVWAAGVTYQKSKEARNREAKVEKDSFYDKVYDAKRPEIFLKSTARRVVGPEEPVGIRSDSDWQIPEPELALVIRADGEIVGYTVGNDMSSRDIEGENPLYLPQAKMWKNSCAIGPAITLAETVKDPYNLEIESRIYRDGNLVSTGHANTSMLKRSYEELVSYLIKDNDIVDGTVLLTGTCIVPDDSFTLQEEDVIEIEIEGIGTLRNHVKLAKNIK